jgi:hypothetical protein
VPRSPDDVKAGWHGAHPVRVRATPVGECLTIVIVLLLAEAQSCEGDIVVGHSVDVMDASACDRSEAEVLRDDGQCIGPVALVGGRDSCCTTRICGSQCSSQGLSSL